MKKSDLKTGMMVVLNSTERYLVLLNTPHGDVLSRIEQGWGYMLLKNYSEDLIFDDGDDTEISEEYSVAEVYSANDIQRLITKRTKRQLLWSRNSDKQ